MILSKSVYINTLTALSYNISKSNLATIASKTCKKVIARVVTLVSRL